MTDNRTSSVAVGQAADIPQLKEFTFSGISAFAPSGPETVLSICGPKIVRNLITDPERESVTAGSVPGWIEKDLSNDRSEVNKPADADRTVKLDERENIFRRALKNIAEGADLLFEKLPVVAEPVAGAVATACFYAFPRATLLVLAGTAAVCLTVKHFAGRYKNSSASSTKIRNYRLAA